MLPKAIDGLQCVGRETVFQPVGSSGLPRSRLIPLGRLEFSLRIVSPVSVLNASLPCLADKETARLAVVRVDASPDWLNWRPAQGQAWVAPSIYGREHSRAASPPAVRSRGAPSPRRPSTPAPPDRSVRRTGSRMDNHHRPRMREFIHDSLAKAATSGGEQESEAGDGEQGMGEERALPRHGIPRALSSSRAQSG